MIWRARIILCGLYLLLPLVPASGYPKEASRIVQISSWPGVSQLITYDQRIWFVNSQPFKDSNVADIYSYSPASGAVRYERSLFSQDAGNPVIYQGLLYWPFEDPRRSAGTGEYVVTDGRNWQWNAFQTGSVMHVHAMNVCNNQLVAVTGSWTGQLHRQTDQSNWQLQYDYPAGAASFSRLVNVREFNGHCIVAAAANGKVEPKLFQIRGNSTTQLQGWPSSDRVDSLTVHRDKLFAFADTGNKRDLLVYDGKNTARIELTDGHRPRAMHSNGESLYLATQVTKDNTVHGQLWVYTAENKFEPIATVQHAPISLTSHASTLYIGTYHQSGGALWGYKIDSAKNTIPVPDAATLLANTAPVTIDENLTDTLYEELQALLGEPETTENYARVLRRSFARHPQAHRPEFGLAITRLLSVRFDSTPVTMFTRKTVSREKLIRWYLLTTLAINGNGKIDPALIIAEDALESTGSGKQFEPSIAAIVATGWLKQNDPQTLQALITRLNRKSDPMWVTADVIGALTAVTGQPFSYDIAAWNQWWNEQL